MKKLVISAILTIFSTLTNAEYVALSLPKQSELNSEKFYKASVAVNKIQDNSVQKAVETILNASPKEMINLVSDKSQAGKSVKFLKMANLKNPKILAVDFGKYTVAFFEIPQKSRLRAGMNYFAFEKNGGRLLWNVSTNDMFLKLVAQADIKNPQKIDTNKIPTFSASDKAKVNQLTKTKMPFLVFQNGALVSIDSVNGVMNERASIFYKKIQDIFFSWQIEKYADFMSEKSKAKFNAQYAGMSAEQKKQTLSDYFSWKKKYLKVMQLSDNEYIVIFARKKQNNPDQLDLAYITFKDGKGYLENFGVKTPLDLMLSRYIFKNKLTLE